MIAEMTAELIVSGNAKFNPDDVQRDYGLVADEIWHIGDQIGRSKLKRNCNAWIISSGKTNSHYLSECLNLLMKKLEVKWQRLLALSDCDSIETQLNVVVYVYDETPALDFDCEVVRRMAEIHASIDIDVIMLGEEDELSGEPK